MKTHTEQTEFHYSALTKDNWDDFVQLFGGRGACGGCWCMSWRLKTANFNKNKGLKNKNALKRLVLQNKPVGIIAYAGQEPIGWCAVAPREDYLRIESSRSLKRVDDEPVWSMPCFFIKKEQRKKNYLSKVIRAGMKWAHTQGAEIIEAYPIKPYSDNMPAAFAWTGFITVFEKLGFKTVAQPSRTKYIVRCVVT
jgi:hypothetical protein